MTIEMSHNPTYFPQYAKQASVLRGIIVDWLNDKLALFGGNIRIKSVALPFFVNDMNVKFVISIELSCHNDDGDFVLDKVGHQIVLDDNLFIFSNLPDFGKPTLNPSINLSSLFFTLESEDGVVSVKPSARKIMIEILIKRQPLFSTLGYECNPGDK